MKKPTIFKDFQSTSSKEWKQKIQADLKGADYNDTLIWESLEGIHIKPFYHSEDLVDQPSFALPEQHKWHIGQHIYANDTAKSNAKAKDVLARGAEHLVIMLPGDTYNIKDLMEGIPLNNSSLYFHFDALDARAIKEIIDHFKTTKAQVFLGIDVIGNFAATGNWYHSEEKDFSIVNELLEYSKTYPNISILGANGGRYQNSGGNIVQQLAYSVAHAVEYLQRDIYDTQIQLFEVAIGNHYFFEIAKLRALRWLWATICDSFDHSGTCQILAIPSKRNKTLYDYNVNMLRTTSESMAAVLGGADTICNLRYDTLFYKDNEFGERIARNQLLLLKEESYFDEATHAAEGSYYIESLTVQLAEKALVLFKEIEAAGGFLKQSKSGNIQKKIKESAAKEQAKFDAGKLILLGTNSYQNPEDKMKDKLVLYPFVKTEKRKTAIEPIIEKRLAEELEQNRIKNE